MKLFLAGESLVSDIPAGDGFWLVTSRLGTGNTITFFTVYVQCTFVHIEERGKCIHHHPLEFIIYLARILCLSFVLSYSCRPVIFLSYSCHICGTLSYSLCFSYQTDKGDETEGL
jgi:hypothetical protein